MSDYEPCPTCHKEACPGHRVEMGDPETAARFVALLKGDPTKDEVRQWLRAAFWAGWLTADARVAIEKQLLSTPDSADRGTKDTARLHHWKWIGAEHADACATCGARANGTNNFEDCPGRSAKEITDG